MQLPGNALTHSHPRVAFFFSSENRGRVQARPSAALGQAAVLRVIGVLAVCAAAKSAATTAAALLRRQPGA